MTTNTLKKVLAGSIAGAMLLPMAASAHGLGLNFGGDLGLGLGGDKEKTHIEGNGKFNVNTNTKVGERGDRDGRDERKDEHKKEVKAAASASTTASVITKAGNRIKVVADVLGSVGATLETKLAALGTTSLKVAAATVDYKVQLTGAKTQAQTAIDAAATLNTSSSTSTVDAIRAQAKDAFKAARDFLKAARADLMVMFRFLVQN